MKKYGDIIYDSFGNKLDIYQKEESKKTIIYFHGGGLIEGDKWGENIVSFAKTFNENGYSFVSVSYRMYPNYKFPDYLIDARNSIKFILDNHEKYGLGSEIIVSGQSAGAYITLMLALDTNLLKEVGINSSDIKAYISDAAQTTTHFHILEFERKLDPNLQRIDEAAPIYYCDNNTKISNMLLLYYENDMAMRAEQNILLYKTILHFNPSANISIRMLPGWHCMGSSVKEEDGEYRYIKESLSWLKENNI